MSGNWYRGNAAEDGRETRGWLLGHFIDPAQGVRSSRMSRLSGESTLRVTSATQAG